MIRFDFFRALSPSSDYPNTPLNLTFDEVKYDLVLPDYVSDVLITNASLDNGLSRLDKYCNREGFCRLRNSPQEFQALAAGMPAFANAEFAFDACNDGVPSGYIARFVAISLPPITTIIDVLHHLKIVEPGVQKYIRQNPKYFKEAGAFEVARVVYYFNEQDQRDLRTDPFLEVGTAYKPRRSRLQFIEFVKAARG